MTLNQKTRIITFSLGISEISRIIPFFEYRIQILMNPERNNMFSLKSSLYTLYTVSIFIQVLLKLIAFPYWFVCHQAAVSCDSVSKFNWLSLPFFSPYNFSSVQLSILSRELISERARGNMRNGCHSMKNVKCSTNGEKKSNFSNFPFTVLLSNKCLLSHFWVDSIQYKKLLNINQNEYVWERDDEMKFSHKN